MRKPTKWLCAQRRLRSAWASAQSDQSSLYPQWVAKDPIFLHANSKDSDQTGRMPRLICVFAGRTLTLLVVMRQLICEWSSVRILQWSWGFQTDWSVQNSVDPDETLISVYAVCYSIWIFWKHYCKFPKYSDTQKICCNHSKMRTMWLYHRVMSPNDADGMANSADPDQTQGAVWSGSALFAQAYLSENLESLWEAVVKPYCSNFDIIITFFMCLNFSDFNGKREN